MVLTPRRREAVAIALLLATASAAMVLTLLLAASMAFAGKDAGASPCPDGERRVGDIGIIELSGLARYSQTSQSVDGKRTDQRVVVFRGEPRVLRLASDAPAAGRMREGDVLVSIDGAFITTYEGSRRFANLVPGQPILLQLRRDGRPIAVQITPSARCGDAPLWVSAREAPEAPVAPVAPRVAASAQRAPRAEATPPAAPGMSMPDTPPVPEVAATPHARSMKFVYREVSDQDQHIAWLMARRGWLGVGIDCEGCHWEPLPGDSGVVWASREFPVIYSVDPGSPADKGGLQRGDVLTHMDGVSLLTPEGARRFGALRPGQSVRWTYRRDGRPGVATTVAASRPGPMGEYARSMTDLREQLKRVRGEQGDLSQMRRQLAELDDQLARVEASRGRVVQDQRLRYSGSVGDADVVVKGLGTVVVTTDETTGELVITTADATVRIRPGGKAPTAKQSVKPR